MRARGAQVDEEDASGDGELVDGAEGAAERGGRGLRDVHGHRHRDDADRDAGEQAAGEDGGEGAVEAISGLRTDEKVGEVDEDVVSVTIDDGIAQPA